MLDNVLPGEDMPPLQKNLSGFAAKHNIKIAQWNILTTRGA